MAFSSLPDILLDADGYTHTLRSILDHTHHRRVGYRLPVALEISINASGDTRPIDQYQKLIDAGSLQDDDHQTKVVQKLQELHDNLLPYDPPPIPDSVKQPKPKLLGRLFGSSTRQPVNIPTSPPTNAPKSLYLYGDVGSGKTMLMDLFYHSLPQSVTRKRRIHFHAFMIDVHKRIHAAKINLGHDGGDPILPVARDLAADAYVLCFDEFQVRPLASNIALLFE